MGYGIIPIQKKSVQGSNYKQPIPYGLSYSKSFALVCRQRKSRIKSLKKENTFFRRLYSLDRLIDVNECDILCNKQLKNDTQKYSKVRIQPKMNVILWKDKTKSSLAQYYY